MGSPLKHKVYVQSLHGEGIWVLRLVLCRCLLLGLRHAVFVRRLLSPLFFGLHPQHVELTANTSTEFTLLHTLDSTKLCFLKCIFTPVIACFRGRLI